MKTAKQWIGEATLSYKRGKYFQAIDACGQAITLEPQNAMAYNWRGITNVNCMSISKRSLTIPRP